MAESFIVIAEMIGSLAANYEMIGFKHIALLELENRRKADQLCGFTEEDSTCLPVLLGWLCRLWVRALGALRDAVVAAERHLSTSSTCQNLCMFTACDLQLDPGSVRFSTAGSSKQFHHRGSSGSAGGMVLSVTQYQIQSVTFSMRRLNISTQLTPSLLPLTSRAVKKALRVRNGKSA